MMHTEAVRRTIVLSAVAPLVRGIHDTAYAEDEKK